MALVHIADISWSSRSAWTQSEFQDSQGYTAIINNVAMNIVEHISYYKLEHVLGT